MGNSWNKVLATSKASIRVPHGEHQARVSWFFDGPKWWFFGESLRKYVTCFFTFFFHVFSLFVCDFKVFLWEFPWQCLCNIGEAYIKELWLRGWNSHKHDEHFLHDMIIYRISGERRKNWRQMQFLGEVQSVTTFTECIQKYLMLVL